MKARVQSTPRLSIGMIVKNEEDNLRGCLESLCPLMDAVDCELIIADTGSTDNTVEIAKEFTENVYHFEWCDDFSAARNSGIDRAVGEWFIYFDADHILDENISALVEFLNGAERAEYNMAGVTIRDYTTKDKKHYDDHLGLQMIRRAIGSRFIEPIHETFQPIEPIAIIDVILHHTGYLFEENELLKKKISDRNMPMILKELEICPEDLRMLMQAIDSADEAEKPEYLKRARAVVQKQNAKDAFSKRMYQAWAIFYMRSDPEKAREAVEEYFSYNFEPSPVDIPLHFVIADIERAAAHPKEALAACERYLAVHEAYESGKIPKDDLFVMELRAHNKRDVDTINLVAADCCKKLGNPDRALEYSKKVRLAGTDPDIFDQLISQRLNIWLSCKKYDGMAELYRDVWGSEEDIRKTRFAEMFELWYLNLESEEHEKIEREMENASGAGELGEIMSLLAHRDRADFAEKLEAFFERAIEWKRFAGIYYRAAIDNGCAMPNAAYSLQNERMTLAIIAAVPDKDEDAVKRAADYCTGDFTDSIRSVLWQATVLERAVAIWWVLGADDKLLLANAFVDAMWLYISNVYNPELLNDEDISVLPRQQRFGYYLHSARECDRRGDEMGFFRELRNALRNYEAMKELVDLLIERHKTAASATAISANAELAAVARGFKDAIGRLIAAGSSGEARDALRKYTEMFPGDAEAKKLLEGLER